MSWEREKASLKKKQDEPLEREDKGKKDGILGCLVYIFLGDGIRVPGCLFGFACDMVIGFGFVGKRKGKSLWSRAFFGENAFFL